LAGSSRFPSVARIGAGGGGDIGDQYIGSISPTSIIG
jgi:hypothetical protein